MKKKSRRRARRLVAREIFLSHSSRNSRFVTTLAQVLGAHGLRVWYSKTHIRGAQQWHDEIGKALSRCDWFVLVLSPSSVGSVWVRRELHYALSDSRFENRIVPVLMKKCDIIRLSWTLPSFQMVDFTHGIQVGYGELLRVFGVDYDPDLT